MCLASTVEVASHFAAFIDLALERGHGMTAFFTDHFTGKTAGLVTVAVCDLFIFLKFPLVSEPDI